MNKTRTRTLSDYAFCLIVGSLYVFAIANTILVNTLIYMGTGRLFLIGALAITVFLCIMFNRVTLAVTAALVIVIGGIFLFTLEDFAEQYPYLYDMWQMIQGYLFNPELGVTLMWIIVFLLGLVVSVSMFSSFGLLAMAIVGFGIFITSLIPGFHRDDLSLFIFIIALMLIMVRRMNKSSKMALIVSPLCAGVLIASQIWLPAESGMYVRRTIDDIRTPTIIEDMIFEFFNPMYFSFQSTGFSGAGGRLGGAVTLNNRPVMTIEGPALIYLSGAINDTFTGYSWIQELEEDAIYTHGLPPWQFEKLETTAALIRHGTMTTWNEQPAIESLREMLPMGEIQQSRNLRTVRMSYPYIGGFFAHSYLPIDTVTINIGAQRTGTIFRPQNMLNIEFDQANGGRDYMELGSISPVGDLRAPGFMSRDTVYQIQFLNVNQNLSFVQHALNQTGYGFYTYRRPPITFGGELGAMIPEIAYENLINQMLVAFRDIPSGFMYHFLNLLVLDGYEAFSELIPLWHEVEVRRQGDYLVFDGNVVSISSAMRAIGFAVEGDVIHGIEDMQALFNLFIGINDERDISTIHGLDTLQEWLDYYTQTILAPYAAQVRQHFMQIPEITPTRVFDLTHQIIADAGAENDFQRVMAIRDYLRQFPYTLDTMPVPPNVCFVDHFLFTGREGYCTYFASAMAIMSRIAGIPSRYVEGFIIQQPHITDTPFLVTNRMAHAWVEVYLEGFGWLIVEATPAYVNAGTATFQPTPVIPEQVGADWGEWFDEEAWLHQMQGGVWSPDMTDWTTPEEYEVIDEIVITPVTMQDIRTVGMWILAAVIALCLAYAVKRYWRIEKGIKKAVKLNTRQRTVKYFVGIMSIVTYYTKPLKDGETVNGYAGHMGRRFAFKSDSVFFRDIIELYNKAKYSSQQVTDAEAALMEEAYFDLLRLLKSRRWRWHFMYLRYVKNIGAV